MYWREVKCTHRLGENTIKRPLRILGWHRERNIKLHL